MSPRRDGIGPHRIHQGAIMKQTFTGKDKCFIGGCTNRPNQIVTNPFKQKIWVCKKHAPRNPYEDQ